MRTNEIIHINGRYRKPDCDLLDSSHVLIRIRTGKDIREVQVVYNDPYVRIRSGGDLQWPSKKMRMKKTGETEESFFFSAVLTCGLHRLKYYFQLYDGTEWVQYSESGITRGYNENDLAMFFIPYITRSNIFEPPEWIRNIVWYQILPVRFNRNLRGISEKLEYLKDLGVSGIYLNPIYYARSYHKYDVIDYTRVDPELGAEMDFEELCAKAHSLGMKVMLDISLTHCSDENPMFREAVEKGSDSPCFKMFKMNRNQQNGEIEYECFGMIRSMPKFETENDRTIDYFANKVVPKWMALGVDAWRLDVANEISDKMLADIKHVVRDKKKETYIVGEIWHNATEWISNDGLDGVTNYAISRAILAFICDSGHSITKYRSAVDELLHSYTLKQVKSSMPLLDSHDTPRLRTSCGDDRDKVKAALLLLLTFYGTPSIYYGTERYMEGGGDPDNRRPVDWEDESEPVQDLYRICRRFLQLRREHPVLANDGTYEWIDHNELLIIRRSGGGEELYVVLSSKEYDIDTVLPMGDEFINLINGDRVYRNVHMGRMGFMVLRKA